MNVTIVTRRNLPSLGFTSYVPLNYKQTKSAEQLENVSVLKSCRLLTLQWKLGALGGDDLNNATQFSLTFVRKDIVVPAVNWCGIDHVLQGGRDALGQNQSRLRNGVEADLSPKSAGTVQDRQRRGICNK